MGLEDITPRLSEEKKNFERRIVEIGKDISLQDIIDQIQLPIEGHGDFCEGEIIKELICQGNYEVIISPEGVVGRYSEIQIAKFDGQNAIDYYKICARGLLEKQRDPPF